MKSLPIRRAQFGTADFAAWLAANGAEVGQPTNPYEVIRYRAYWCGSKKAVTHVVYAKESGLLTFSCATREHYLSFLSGASLEDQRPRASEPVNPRPKKAGPTKAEKTRHRLRERDGDECWFCGTPMGDDCTIEHLVPKSEGGGNKLANYALAHAACNHRAADMPLVQKIEMRTRLRGSVLAQAAGAKS